MQISQSKLFIKQKVETLEIFTGFETKNRYKIIDEFGHDLFYAFEESDFFMRNLLSGMRSLKVQIIDDAQTPQLIIERPFFFFLAKHTVKLPTGEVIGYINQKFAILKTVLEVRDASGQLRFTCISKFPHFWTFNLFIDGAPVAQILKKWSGLGKELFTDADTFMIDFNTVTDNNLKQLILATAFAIDLRVFERK